MDFLLNRKLTRTKTQYQNNISNICRISELPMYSKKNNGRFFLQYNEITLLSKFLWSKILIQKILDLAVRVVCWFRLFTDLHGQKQPIFWLNTLKYVKICKKLFEEICLHFQMCFAKVTINLYKSLSLAKQMAIFVNIYSINIQRCSAQNQTMKSLSNYKFKTHFTWKN